MLLRRNEGKGFVITEDSEDDIADLVHHSAKSRHLGFRVALCRVVVLQDWIFELTGTGGPNGLYGDDIDYPPGVTGAALGEPGISVDKIAGLLYSRVQAKVGIELFGTAESMEIANFADQSNGAVESNPWDGLKQVNLPHKGFARVYFENLLDLEQQLPGLLVQSADHTNEVANSVSIYSCQL